MLFFGLATIYFVRRRRPVLPRGPRNLRRHDDRRAPGGRTGGSAASRSSCWCAAIAEVPRSLTALRSRLRPERAPARPRADRHRGDRGAAPRERARDRVRRVRARAALAPVSRNSARRALEERRLTLADADAERREAVAPAAAAELVEERDDEARAAHPERVADARSRRR